MLRLRLAVLLAAAATAVTLAAPASSQAAGWRCNAGALTGSVLGQALPGAVTAGSTTADCKTSQATNPLSVPPLLDVAALEASTSAAGTTARATGGVVDLALHSTPALPITLPPVTIPDALTHIQVSVPPLGTLAEVDLTPAIQAVLANRRLPNLNLLNVKGAVAYAGGQCVGRRPQLSGTSQMAAVSILGQEVGTGSLVDKTLTLLDTGGIKLSDLDLTLAKVTVLGMPFPVGTSTLLSLLQPILGTGPIVVIPATLAQIKVTPGDQTETENLLVQRALRIQASIAGQSIADLVVGQAAIADAGVDCSAPADQVPPQEQSATELALACTKRKIVLIDVLRRGDHVKLLGAADKQYAGRTVSIKFLVGNRTVAKAKVRKDGSFSTTAPLPKASLRGTNRARYRAVIGGERSLNLKLTRRMLVDSVTSSGGRVRIKGRVTQPLGRPVQPIVVKRRVTCSKTVTVAKVRPSRNGRFSVTVKAPKDSVAAVYRLSTKVRTNVRNPKLYPTFTLPRAVDL